MAFVLGGAITYGMDMGSAILLNLVLLCKFLKLCTLITLTQNTNEEEKPVWEWNSLEVKL